MSDECSKVIFDPELHKWHKQFTVWQEWVKSKEYAEAFKAYYKEGSVPLNRYPPLLVKRNLDKGTLEIEKLDGIHEWREIQDSDFLATAIYNERLATWKKRVERVQKRKEFRESYSNPLARLHIPILPIIGWGLFLVAFISLFIRKEWVFSDYFVYMMIFFASAAALAISFFLTYSLPAKLLHGAGVICAILWGLSFAGSGNPEVVIFAIPLTFFAAFMCLYIGVKLLWVRLKSGAAGYGWNEGSDRYYQRKRR